MIGFPYFLYITSSIGDSRSMFTWLSGWFIHLVTLPSHIFSDLLQRTLERPNRVSHADYADGCGTVLWCHVRSTVFQGSCLPGQWAWSYPPILTSWLQNIDFPWFYGTGRAMTGLEESFRLSSLASTLNDLDNVLRHRWQTDNDVKFPSVRCAWSHHGIYYFHCPIQCHFTP